MFAARKTDGAATAAAASYIEDVFSTYLYTGNGSVQTIPNSIALGSVYGGSVFFDGGGDYISAPANAAFDFSTGNFTIEFWYYPNSISGARTLIEVNYGTAPNFIMQPSSGVMNFYTNGVSASVISNVTDTIGSWYHYAAVRNGSTITLYRNGISVGTTTYSGNVGNSSAACFIGGSLGGGGYYIDGYLSNVRVVKGTAVYTSAFTPPTAPLTAISGTSLLTCKTPNTVLDYSSNAFTITVTNAVAQNGGGPFTDSTANKGGLVWLKSRSAAGDHALYDTNRGATFDLVSNSTAAQTTQTTGLTSFNANGFSIGTLAKLNTNAATYASWTFRKQAKFFDVVTFTTGTSGSVSFNHSIGSTPGCVLIKLTSTTGSWFVWHRSLNQTDDYLNLDSTAAKQTSAGLWTVNSSSVSIAASRITGSSGVTGVAYLFAHDAGGFGATGTDNVITCGSFTTDGSGNATVNLGYEPQWVMLKRSDSTGNWLMMDAMRGMPVTANSSTQTGGRLYANLSNADDGFPSVIANATGFTTVPGTVAASATYIYIAIRRGPMKTPTSGTSVFYPLAVPQAASLDTSTVPFPPDLVNTFSRNGTARTSTYLLFQMLDRLRGLGVPSTSYVGGSTQLVSSSTAAEDSSTNAAYVSLLANSQDITRGTGWGNALYGDWVNYFWRRAPGFFDVVCDTGTASAHTITHGLTVVPELMIRKKRNSATNSDWVVWHTAFTGTTKYLYLNSTAAEDNNSAFWTSTAPTSTVFSVGTGSRVNNTGDTYVTYLFASVNGVSKVGSYTGNGSSQTINCGFTAGARFILIKRTSSTGDWYVWDTARGIVSGNDPRLSLNSTAAEVTTDDSIDPDNSGFIVNQLAATNINVNAATYIYLAIA